MNITREKKKEEAIRRMQKIGLFDDMIVAFDEDDALFINEPPLGAIYDLTDDEKKMVQDFEGKYNALVYAIIRTYTSIGKMDAMLYVNDELSEWVMDIEDLDNETVYAYVVNHDIPILSEFRQIGWKLTTAGGLVRTM